MRNRINNKGFISDLFNSPNKLVIETSPSVSGGFTISGKKVIPDNIVWVESASDFPAAISGTVNLESNKAYLITRDVNVGNTNFFVPAGVTIHGFGRYETGIISTITTGSMFSGSNGFRAQNMFLQSANVSSSLFDISAIETAENEVCLNSLRIVSSGLGNIGSCRQFEMTDSVFALCHGGFTFDGNYTEILFHNVDTCQPSDFSAVRLAEYKPTVTVDSRIRTSRCRLLVNSGQIGISASDNLAISDEGFELFHNYFSGSGDFVAGISSSSDKAFYVDNVGLRSTIARGVMLLNSNSLPTIIDTKDTYFKISGTTSTPGITLVEPLEKFTHTTGRLTYTSRRPRIFAVDALVSVLGSATANYTIALFKNSQLISGSNFPFTTFASGRFFGAKSNAQLSLEKDDFIELYIQNNSSTADVTVTQLYFSISES